MLKVFLHAACINNLLIMLMRSPSQEIVIFGHLGLQWNRYLSVLLFVYYLVDKGLETLQLGCNSFLCDLSLIKSSSWTCLLFTASCYMILDDIKLATKSYSVSI